MFSKPENLQWLKEQIHEEPSFTKTIASAITMLTCNQQCNFVIQSGLGPQLRWS